MLLKNTGDKILNVGRDILMPGEEKNFPNGMIGSSTLATLVGMGFLKVSMDKKAEPVKAAPAPAHAATPFDAATQAPAEAPAAETPAPVVEKETATTEKKYTRKSVKKAE